MTWDRLETVDVERTRVSWGNCKYGEGAIDALEDSVRLGNCHYPYYAHRATILGALRENPRFRQLLEVVRQRWERGGAAVGDAAA